MFYLSPDACPGQTSQLPTHLSELVVGDLVIPQALDVHVLEHVQQCALTGKQTTNGKHLKTSTCNHKMRIIPVSPAKLREGIINASAGDKCIQADIPKFVRLPTFGQILFVSTKP